jgi:NAD-dependent SIR2 family protein deacetylase
MDLFDKAEEISIPYDMEGDFFEFSCMQCFSNNKVNDFRDKISDKNSILIIKCDYCSIAYKLNYN